MPESTHPFLLRLAERLLTKAERSNGKRAVRLKLDRHSAPELYAQTDAEQMQRWVMLLEDWCNSGWVSLRLGPAREFASFVDRQPQIELHDFDALASWAGFLPQTQRWQRQWVAYLAARWSGTAAIPNAAALLDYLTRSPLLALQELPMAEAARNLEALQALCASGQRLPIREASARVFQGRSKVLDSREELLRLLGAAPDQFQEAPIQLLLDIPPDINEALFIENLVTFERMADYRQAAWQQSLLIYAAGFRGSAKRLRQRAGCRLYGRADRLMDSMIASNLGIVENWLFGQKALSVRFFGDLDYAGMQILASLRDVFTEAQAWAYGYDRLVDALRQGGGHTPAWADKAQQMDPLTTGCDYADQRLLPAIRQEGRFIDQEAFWPDAD